MPLRVFISHAFKDKAPVEALATALRTLHGVDTWLDHWEIDSAQDIVARINDGLERSQAGLLVYSANAAESEWVKKELSFMGTSLKASR